MASRPEAYWEGQARVSIDDFREGFLRLFVAGELKVNARRDLVLIPNGERRFELIMARLEAGLTDFSADIMVSLFDGGEHIMLTSATAIGRHGGSDMVVQSTKSVHGVGSLTSLAVRPDRLIEGHGIVRLLTFPLT